MRLEAAEIVLIHTRIVTVAVTMISTPIRRPKLARIWHHKRPPIVVDWRRPIRRPVVVIRRIQCRSRIAAVLLVKDVIVVVVSRRIVTLTCCCGCCFCRRGCHFGHFVAAVVLLAVA